MLLCIEYLCFYGFWWVVDYFGDFGIGYVMEIVEFDDGVVF